VPDTALAIIVAVADCSSQAGPHPAGQVYVEFMSGWDPGEGDRETMTLGSESRGSSSSSRPWLPAAVALMVGLLAGVAIGERTDVWKAPGAVDAAATDPDLQAASLQISGESTEHGTLFDLQLLNHDDESVTVTGLAFGDLRGDVAEVELAPGGWESVRFAAPLDCSYGVPPTLTSVRVFLEGADGGIEREVELPGRSSTLRDYYKAVCASGGPPPRRELVGIWTIDDSFPPDELGMSMLWRFQRDGTFVADTEGVLLLDEPRALQGRYSLRRGRLVIEYNGRGYVESAAGHREVWRPRMMSDATEQRVPLMAVTLIEGSDSDGIWVMRRIIDGTDTPDAIG
jgi:hypothetical protein